MDEKKALKIDLSSSMVEKAVDLAKSFLDKLIIPAIEETGLLLKDQVTYFKFKNQVKILNKTREYCEKNNVNIKAVSLKLLCPLLENAGLEEDEYLQDKWATLLGNLIDSEQNIENHVFPYLLSQISSTEFMFIETFVSDFLHRKHLAEIELNEYCVTGKIIENDLEKQIEVIKDKLSLWNELEEKNRNKDKIEKLRKELLENNEKLLEAKRNFFSLNNKFAAPPIIDVNGLKDFEIANLIRLGIMKEVRIVKGQKDNDNRGVAKYLTPGIAMGRRSNSLIGLSNTLDHHVTELGLLLIMSCNSKANFIN